MVFSTRALALSATGLIAVIAGTIGFAHAHPTVAMSPPAVYGLDPAAAPEDPAVVSDSTQERRVNANFSNAPVQKVLDWLAKQDANFVVASSSLPADLRITLNVKDEPLSSVERVIAAAMGGSWNKRDGILVFNRGAMAAPFAIGDSNFHSFFGDKDLKDLKQFKDMPGGVKIWASPDGKAFELKLKDFKNEFGPEFQKKMQNQFGPEFQKKMQDQFGPEFQKKMQDQFGPEFQKKMQDQFGPEFQKKMQDAGKDKGVFIGKNFGGLKVLQNQNLTGLMASLTNEQKATMKRRGYLTPKDLSAMQLKMLGAVKGKFELKVQSEKGTMTIKSE